MAKSLNEQLKSTLFALKKRTDYTGCVKVGFGDDAHYSGMTAAELAKLLNYGDSNFIPERPFLSIHFPEQIKDSGVLYDLLSSYIEDISKNPSGKKQYLDSVGESLVKELKLFMLGNPYGGSSLSNAPSTIRKKKKDHPLVDTGELAGMATYVVRKP